MRLNDDLRRRMREIRDDLAVLVAEGRKLSDSDVLALSQALDRVVLEAMDGCPPCGSPADTAGSRGRTAESGGPF